MVIVVEVTKVVLVTMGVAVTGIGVAVAGPGASVVTGGIGSAGGGVSLLHPLNTPSAARTNIDFTKALFILTLLLK